MYSEQSFVTVRVENEKEKNHFVSVVYEESAVHLYINS